MVNTVIKNKTVSTRVTSDIDERAKNNLAKQGLTVSEFIRLALIKAANDEVHYISFLDTPEALQAKKEAESGETTTFNSLEEFNEWVDKLDEDNND